jgi:ATP-binding cassette subfamily B protein/subfamily B ATP-binding cassette protein MsbA
MPFRSSSSRRLFDQYRRQQRLAEDQQYDPSRPGAHDVPMGRRRGRRQRPFSVLLKAYFHQLGGDRRVIGAVLVALSAATLFGLVPLYGTKVVFDYVLTDQPVPDAWRRWINLPTDRGMLLQWVALAMIGFSLVALMLGVWSRWHATRITKRLQVAVRRRLFEHAVRLPLHRVYELKSGGVASILREDAGAVGELTFSMIYNPWKAIIQLTGSLLVLTMTDWRLLTGSIVIFPIVFFSHRTWISRIRPMWRDIRATRQTVDAGATEAFGGMRVVRSFSRQKTEAAQFIRRNHLMIRQELLAWWWSRGIDIAWSILIPVASACLLWYGGTRILVDQQRVAEGLITFEQSLTVGDLVMFLAYLAALLGPLATLAASATAFQNGLAGLDRVLDLLGETQEMPAGDNAVELNRDDVRGHITLTDVSFNYPRSDKPVLSDINLDVRSGQMIALVGPSGAGKTTLCNLVARFYDPTTGSIELDGRNLRDVVVDSYRRLLGIVEQDIFLFDGSVAQNIAYGRRGATMPQVERAAELANAAGFINELSDGYETLIGERGVKLSGGQRQRLAIARAILADPKILILDEATSNLDTESERLIQASMRTLMAGRTSFVIAHRLSTISHADWILVLEGGRIVEQGRHRELIARSGRYREMVELQTAPRNEPDEGTDTDVTTSR